MAGPIRSNDPSAKNEYAQPSAYSGRRLGIATDGRYRDARGSEKRVYVGKMNKGSLPLAYADDHFHDECGVFGVFGHPEASNLTYLGLYALQHRGQESAGIVSSAGGELHAHRAMGEVEEIFVPAVLAGLPGELAIGHTRYSTAGDKALLNAQPIMVDCNKGKIALGHNGNLTNAAEWRRKLEHRGSIFQTNSDTEVIVHLIARSPARNLSGALGDALNQVEGAYSLLVLTPDELIAVRDPRGFRPLVLGKLAATAAAPETWLVASETCAFDLLNAQYVREVEPGEMVRISKSGIESIHFAPEKPHQHCIFEHVYFARPDSTIFGRSVNASREALGRTLAREHPVDADIIVPVPDSGVPAAVGYSLESKIPFHLGLIRNHYIGRTFIEPSQAIRNFGVKLKLNPVRGLIEGKRVVLVDDSIVRGTTSRKIVRMVREAGAKEVHVRISCPPTVSPCYYGVDTPTKEELIASSNTPEEICRYLGADSLGYVSLAGLRQAVGDAQGTFCTSCYTGTYPTDLVQLEVREGSGNGTLGMGMNDSSEDRARVERPVTVEREV
jgi:amidophosphoribosyltransferase